MPAPPIQQELAVSSESLAALRAEPGVAPALPLALQPVADEPILRARTELFAVALEGALDDGTAIEWLCDLWRGARAGDRPALRCVTSLLEVRLSGVELLRRAIRFTELARACQRVVASHARGAVDARRELVQLADATVVRVGVAPRTLHTKETQKALRERASLLLAGLVEGRLAPNETSWLIEAAELEMRATALRLGDVAETVGACDGRRISRLLPILSKHEERIRDTRALLVKLPAPRELVRRTPVLLTRLEDKGFDGIVRELATRPDGNELARAMVLATWRAPLGPELAFLAGVVRILGERLRRRGTPPLDAARALLATLYARRGEGLALSLTPTEMQSTRSLWQALGEEPGSGDALLVYDPRRHDRFLPEDSVPDLVAPGRDKPVDVRQLVLSNIQNEHLICGLLATPRVSSLPGLVEQIALRSRSMKVLLEIANRRELHTGAANSNVPRALLWHPSGIPVSALRKFIHVRFVGRVELSAIATRNSRARPEIRQLAANYLATLIST